jgi:hypothetical protein
VAVVKADSLNLASLAQLTPDQVAVVAVILGLLDQAQQEL